MRFFMMDRKGKIQFKIWNDLFASFARLLNKANPGFMFLLFFFYCLITALAGKHFTPPYGDLAEYLNNPVRILHGDQPYRDFWLLFPPGEAYAPAHVYEILGINIDVLRNATMLFSVASCGWAFWLGRILFRKNSYAVMLMLLYFYASVISQYIGPDYLHAWFVFLFAAVCFLAKYFINGRNRYLLIAGLFCGIAFLFRFYETAASCFAFALALVYAGKKELIPRSQIYRALMIFFCGIVSILVLFVLFYPGSVALMAQRTVVDGFKNGVTMGLGYFYTFLASGRHLLQSFASLSSVPPSQISYWHLFYEIIKLPVELSFYLLPVFACLAFLLFQKVIMPGLWRVTGVLFFLWGLSLLAKGLGRPDLAHMAASAAPFLIFLLIVYASLHQHPQSVRYAVGVKRITAVILFIMLTLAVHPLFKTILLAKELPYYGRTQRGTVAFRYAIRADNFTQTVAFIEKTTSADDYIFATPWFAPPFYALCDRRNPTAYDSLIDLFMRDSVKDQQAIIKDILAKRTKWIIHDPDWGFDDQPDRSFTASCNILEDFITRQCKLVNQIGKLRFYVPPESGLIIDRTMD